MNLAINSDQQSFLKRFEYFDGACIEQVIFSYSTINKPKCMEFLLTAYDNEALDKKLNDKDPSDKWVQLKLLIEDVKEFKICEGPKTSFAQPDDHIEIQRLNNIIYLIFDPLQSKNFDKQEWSIDEIQSSKYYVGGSFLYWEIIAM